MLFFQREFDSLSTSDRRPFDIIYVFCIDLRAYHILAYPSFVQLILSLFFANDLFIFFFLFCRMIFVVRMIEKHDSIHLMNVFHWLFIGGINTTITVVVGWSSSWESWSLYVSFILPHKPFKVCVFLVEDKKTGQTQEGKVNSIFDE